MRYLFNSQIIEKKISNHWRINNFDTEKIVDDIQRKDERCVNDSK